MQFDSSLSHMTYQRCSGKGKPLNHSKYTSKHKFYSSDKDGFPNRLNLRGSLLNGSRRRPIYLAFCNDKSPTEYAWNEHLMCCNYIILEINKCQNVNSFFFICRKFKMCMSPLWLTLTYISQYRDQVNLKFIIRCL